MADTITNTNTLAVGLEYTDTTTDTVKTVYLKVPNPKSGLSETTIKNTIQQFISGENPILKTPQFQDFDSETAIATAYTETVQRTDYDIGID